jgi:hypothetical protein
VDYIVESFGFNFERSSANRLRAHARTVILMRNHNARHPGMHYADKLGKVRSRWMRRCPECFRMMPAIFLDQHQGTSSQERAFRPPTCAGATSLLADRSQLMSHQSVLRILASVDARFQQSFWRRVKASCVQGETEYFCLVIKTCRTNRLGRQRTT